MVQAIQSDQKVSWWGSWFQSSKAPPIAPRVSTSDDVEFLRRQIRSLERTIRESIHYTTQREDPDILIARQTIEQLKQEKNDERERTERLKVDLGVEREAHKDTRQMVTELKTEAAAERQNMAGLRNENKNLQLEIADLRSERRRSAKHGDNDDERNSPRAKSSTDLIHVNLEGRELPATVLTEDLTERWNDVLQNHWEYSTWMDKLVQLKEENEDLQTDLWKKALGPEEAATRYEENQAIINEIIPRRDALLVSMQPNTEYIFGDMRKNLRKYDLYQEGDLFWRRVTGSFGETDTWLDPPILGKEEALVVLKDWNKTWRQTHEGYTESEWEEWERGQEGQQEGGEEEEEEDYLAGSFM
ncbi:uncharacterized protein EAE98_012069 [Botrytis deweyae]|uniref:Autophagy-related protein 16 domain-containing protein n=1 Tax=Botrytis deweyae TaxID=2478750 RepID=A0ABQ7I3Y0_9HELO|nr:uncharacterized protein EAE98_012069 [Botrytis deweyae]KAF7910382.1 hypothetical protein EAE98_012069 [Botrytis deweyae]